MDDCIKREQVLKLLESAQAWNWSMNTLYDEIQALPAEDAAPVVHAKWIQDLDTDEWTCPNCGAKMDLEEDK